VGQCGARHRAEPRECLRILKSISDSDHPALIVTYRNDPDQPANPSGYHRYGATEWVEVEGERPDLGILVVVEGAEHVQSWNSDPGAYEKRVLESLATVG
jgi:hypothetical protein